MSHPLAWLDDALIDLDRRGLRRQLGVTTRHAPAAEIELAGQSLINFGSNDYLGLASDPRVIAAVKTAIDQYGWGAAASPLVTGRNHLHAQLERAFADFEATEAALLFPTGYAANVGTIAALVGKEDAVYSDQFNHASIIDGCKLSGAKVFIYRHLDDTHLEQSLRSETRFRHRLIVTESLFSMHGDFAPLASIAALAKRFSAMLMVDEAHATGVFGEKGRGCCERAIIEDRVDVRVGTLSKSLGSVGGFVAGPRKLIDWLANRARPYVYSTACPAASAAAGLAALDILQPEMALGNRLLDLAGDLRKQLADHHLLKPHAAVSQIIPIILGDPDRALAASAGLRRRGLYVPAIRPPSVPQGQSLLRISLTASHTVEQINSLISALIDVTKLHHS
jgi:8-amino-7-oxononanoate synthase